MLHSRASSSPWGQQLLQLTGSADKCSWDKLDWAFPVSWGCIGGPGHFQESKGNKRNADFESLWFTLWAENFQVCKSQNYRNLLIYLRACGRSVCALIMWLFFQKTGFPAFLCSFQQKKVKYFNLVWVNNPNYSKFTFWAGDDCCAFVYSVTLFSHLFTFMLKLKTVCNHHISMNSWLLTLWSRCSSSVELTQIRVRLHSNTSPVCGEGSSYVLIDIHSCETLTVCCRRLNHCQSIPAGTWRSRFCSSRRAGRFWQQRNLCCGRNHKPISQSAELMQKLQHGIFVAEGELEWKLLLHTKTLAGIKQLGKYLNLQTQLQ